MSCPLLNNSNSIFNHSECSDASKDQFGDTIEKTCLDYSTCKQAALEAKLRREEDCRKYKQKSVAS